MQSALSTGHLRPLHAERAGGLLERIPRVPRPAVRARDDERADDRQHHAQREHGQGGCGSRRRDGRAGDEQGGVQREEEARAVPRERDLGTVVRVGELVVGEWVGLHAGDGSRTVFVTRRATSRYHIAMQRTPGGLLAEAISSRGLSWSEFARRCGVSYMTVLRWRKDDGFPADARRKAALALCLPATHLDAPAASEVHEAHSSPMKGTHASQPPGRVRSGPVARVRFARMDTNSSEQPSPDAAAQDLLAELIDVPPDVLRQLAVDVLRIVNDDQPGITRAAAHLRARAAIATMLSSFADDAERDAERSQSGPWYFGRRPWGPAADDPSLRGPTPVNECCLHCEEPIEVGDAGVVMMHVGVAATGLRAQHRECFLRGVVGSAAHIEKRCTCFGGTDADGDPPELSRREAARLACRLAGAAES